MNVQGKGEPKDVAVDKMDSNELKWVKQVSLESLFNMQWTTLREDML